MYWIRHVLHINSNKRVVSKHKVSKLLGYIYFLTTAIPYGQFYLSNLYIDLNSE